MNKYTFKQRLQYWLDGVLSKGMSSVISLLLAATFVIGLMIALVVIICELQGDATGSEVVWNSFASLLTGNVPYAEDITDGLSGYLFMIGLASIIGLLFTSVLIGVISTAIEERLHALRKGNSLVLESGHIVILGYEIGEFKLIEELIHSVGNDRMTIVVADSKDKEEMEDNLRACLEIPANIKVLFRSINITNPTELECCAITQARTVILRPMENHKCITCIMALNKVLEGSTTRPQIISSVSNDKYILPRRFLAEHGILELQTYDMVARIIAHCCTQPGLSHAFVDLFNCDGSELYIRRDIPVADHTFGDMVCAVNGGVPVGIIRNGKTILNPYSEMVLTDQDALIVYSEEKDSAHITGEPENLQIAHRLESNKESQGTVVVVGCNEVLDTILDEMPEQVERIILVGVGKDKRKELVLEGSPLSAKIRYVERAERRSQDQIEELARQADHFVLLSDHSKTADRADVDSMIALIQLRDLKERLNLAFNITVEMRRESNKELVVENTGVDFVVASDMSSMIMSQLAQKPELIDAFNELLSNSGNELVLRNAEEYGYDGMQMTIAQLRHLLLEHNCILLGIIREANNVQEVSLNPNLHDEVALTAEDEFVVIKRY